MPRKHRSLKTPQPRADFDLTLVELLVTNQPNIEHSPEVDHILDQAISLLHAGDGVGAEHHIELLPTFSLGLFPPASASLLTWRRNHQTHLPGRYS